MNNNNYKVTFTVIGNRDCGHGVGFGRSVKDAIKRASQLAWLEYEKQGNTNWADNWMVICNPYGRTVYADFASSY